MLSGAGATGTRGADLATISTLGAVGGSGRAVGAVTTVAGLEYNADCWLGRIVMQEFATFTGVSNRAIYFQIELGGLTRIGSNPLGVLRQNVIGYQRVNTLNQGQYQDDYYPVQ